MVDGALWVGFSIVYFDILPEEVAEIAALLRGFMC